MKEKLVEILDKKEFLFEDGLKKIIEKINELFTTQDNVVVAIGGPAKDDTNVGKTDLSTKLEMNFIRQGVPVLSASDLTIFEAHHPDSSELAFQQKNRGSSKCLVILGAVGILSLPQDKQLSFRESNDRRLQEITTPAGLPDTKIDLYILIYRPDKLASADQRQFADIIIRNELAKD
ncbi:MAG: hypothetical protein NTV81_02265 [Candidatus Komeilibacteria bacterium]|nr:hypothetical protein [Candidatus Komeilibacteria bacterium]